MNTNREFFSELILIIAGFILAETIIRKYIEFTTGVVSWWVLPLIAIALISLAIRIKNKEQDTFTAYYSWIMFLLLILFVGLYQKQVITPNDYIWVTLVVLGLFFIIFFSELLWKRKKNKRK